MDKYKNLRKRSFVNNGRESAWNLNNLKDGLEYYFELHNFYPTVRDVDKFEYLPTSRTIQRSFGGMMELRRILNLNTPVNFSSGETRSSTARMADNRAKEYEERFFRYLVKRIDEVRVHEHKIIRPSDTAADFFIYKNNLKDGVIVDLFFAKDIYSLSGIINIKSKKYTNINFQTFFVLVEGSEITQDDIDLKINNRKNTLSGHIRVLTEDSFKKALLSILE